MKPSNRLTVFIGLLLIAAVCCLSIATPFSEAGAIAKQFLFPFLIGAIWYCAFPFHPAFRITGAILTALGAGLYASGHSNGFDWRMDGEWDLVVMSLVLQAGSAIAGLALGRVCLSAWRQRREVAQGIVS